jgi:lipoprotein-anchoring transpeptidase ErfK/SrfK
LSVRAPRLLPRRPAREAADPALSARRRPSTRLVVGLLVLVALASFAAIAVTLSRTRLLPDDSALARVDVGALGGTLVSATAIGPHDGRILLAERDGRLTPLRHVPPGTALTVVATVRRPGWNGWALGRQAHERLTIRTPSAHSTTRWTTLRGGAQLRVTFDTAVARIAYGPAGHLQHVTLRHPRRTIDLGAPTAAGTIELTGAPRTWETLPATRPVTWFPAGGTPMAVASPAPGTPVGPTSTLRLTFSKPVPAHGAALPTFAVPTPGRWHRADSHTLTFTPSGTGFGLGAHVQLTLPGGVQATGPTGPVTTPAVGTTGTLPGTTAPVPTPTGTGTTIAWAVPPGSTLRLHELLAQLSYLPLAWHPAGRPVGSDDRSQLAAAVAPPHGSFDWRWHGLPAQLTSQWKPAEQNAITRGALMAFQSDHALAADAVAGPQVWTALFAALRSHRANAHGYSYVLVHRDTATQTMTLFHDGKQVTSSPANTGVASAPTQLGTFPVYLRYTVTTMSGTNPDGSKYNDPGIRWVSYFNGGDALHAFNRASFGTPQSVGCVELPEAAAAKIYPYTPIGTLVTVAP